MHATECTRTGTHAHSYSCWGPRSSLTANNCSVRLTGLLGFIGFASVCTESASFHQRVRLPSIPRERAGGRASREQMGTASGQHGRGTTHRPAPDLQTCHCEVVRASIPSTLSCTRAACEDYALTSRRDDRVGARHDMVRWTVQVREDAIESCDRNQGNRYVSWDGHGGGRSGGA